uniref:COX2_TM domain-containing protein n=1 Tax=Strongyloides venezuelensis TaxID=75913 RepID=A0A0K0F121_STRVS
MEVIHFNSFVIFILPIILIFINYLIYQYVAKKMSNNNKSKIAECRKILKGLIVQGLFTLIFQIPSLFYTLYSSMTFNFIDYLEIPIEFLHYTGYSLYVFCTMIAIKDFRIMMLKDFGINNKIKPNFVHNSPIISKFVLN